MPARPGLRTRRAWRTATRSCTTCWSARAGQLRLAAFGAVEAPPAAPEADARRAQRDDAERDVLAIGVLLHQMLSGAPVLDEADVSAVIARMPPHGRDLVRLP